MPDVSLIIVTWNSLADLRRCVDSLRQSKPKISYELIVVDNGSTDGTVEFVQQNYQNARLIANRENRGFAAANNQALEIASGRYLLLLNPDTRVHPGALDNLVAFMDSHPDAAAVGPALRNDDGTAQHTGVRFPSNWNILVETLALDRIFPRSRIFGGHKELFADQHVPRSVEYVQGACLMVRAEIVRTVGGMDEQFFLYFEEVDWCKRMHQAGYSVYICPSASVTHFANMELGHFDAHRLVHYHRSLILFYKKHYHRRSLMILRGLLVCRSLIRLIVWAFVACVRPALRCRAASSFRGYARVLRLVWVA